MKSIIGGIVVAILATPAFANEYWVEYNYSTHECSVVEKTPQESSPGATQGASAAGTASVPAATDTPADQTASGTPNNGNPSDTAAADNPPTDTATAENPANNTAASDNTDDPTAALAAAWKRKEAEAKASHKDITKAFIGTAMQSREDAEDEMKIMRKCGINN